LVCKKNILRKKIIWQLCKKKINLLGKNLDKTEVKSASLFFDLSLIDKKATADRFSYYKDFVTILDQKNKKAYVINAKNKNKLIFGFSQIKNPTFAVYNGQTLFIFDPSGIYSSTNEQAAKKIITKDKDWQDIADFQVFNSNLYLLDRGSDEIYKYLPIEAGYSSKESYIKSGQQDLSRAKNLTIDYSLYLLGENGVYKYTSGLLDEFKADQSLDFPSLSRVYKGESNQKVFLLNSSEGKLNLLDKKGALEKVIVDKSLRGVNYFAAPNDTQVIFLKNNQIYSLDNL
jgi:hypothetical protein